MVRYREQEEQAGPKVLGQKAIASNSLRVVLHVQKQDWTLALTCPTVVSSRVTVLHGVRSQSTV